MIDLNKLREMAEHIKNTYATPYDFKVLEAIDRAINAESRVAELEVLLKDEKEYSAKQYTSAGNYMLQAMNNGAAAHHAESECDELKSKLAELSQPIANNSEPVQRITEQDAREIIDAFCRFTADRTLPQHLKAWFESSYGGDLLAKLNEHREPVEAASGEALRILDQIISELTMGFVACKRCGEQEETVDLDCMSDLEKLRSLLGKPVQESQPLAPNDSDRSLSENSDLVKSIQDIWFKSGCAHLMNKTTAMNIIDAVVTANKEEVPLNALIGDVKSDILGLRTYENMNGDNCVRLDKVIELIDSLQPLKGEPVACRDICISCRQPISRPYETCPCGFENIPY